MTDIWVTRRWMLGCLATLPFLRVRSVAVVPVGPAVTAGETVAPAVYTYRAVDLAGNYGPLRTMAGIPDAVNGQIQLTWESDPSPDVSHYDVYRNDTLLAATAIPTFSE
mgnify:CR=1 FL=1